MDNLPELRDIHIPDGVSALPPAYGWWVILGAVIGIILITIIRRKSKKNYALKLLNDIHTANAVKAAKKMSEILRRICVYKYQSAAVLFGAEWMDFLQQKTKFKLSQKAAKLLTDAPYLNEDTPTYGLAEATEIKKFCREWIGDNL